MASHCFLLLDALSSQYLDPDITPTLWGWKQDGGYCELEPLFAFKGVAAAMYSGLPPNETGKWMDFKIEKESKPQPGYRLVNSLPGFTRKVAVTLYERVLNQASVTAHRIPPRIRPFLSAASNRPMTEPGALQTGRTIFDLMERNGVSYRAIGHSGGPQEPLLRLAPAILKLPADVHLLKITLLDHIGHNHGPDSGELRQALTRVDSLVDKLQSKNPGMNIFVYSDHGMTKVEECIPLRRIVRKRLPSLTEGEDYLPFYGSTCAYFRWRSEESREMVSHLLRDLDGIVHLRGDELKELRIDECVQSYGDDIFATTPGTILNPDFYSSSGVQGMHGFAGGVQEKAVALSPDRELRDEGWIGDLAPSFAQMLDLDCSELGSQSLIQAH